MSYKHYKPATAKETAAQKKRKKEWDKLSAAEKKKRSKRSTPLKINK